jgi:diacylglycerol kinase
MKNAFSIKARIQSFIYAFEGLKVLLGESNFVIHLFVAVFVIIGGLYFQVSKIEWLFLMVSIGVVLCAESFNTALEYLVDLVSPSYHDLAKKSKDVAAMSVLLAVLMAICIGLTVFIPYLLQ